MPYYYVVCITKKPNRSDPYTAIQAYGIVSDVQVSIATQRWTQAEMIQKLESGTTVKTHGTNPRSGQREYVGLEVIQRSDGSKYVKSKSTATDPTICSNNENADHQTPKSDRGR